MFSLGAEGGTRWRLFAGVYRRPPRACFLVSSSLRVYGCLLLSLGSAVRIDGVGELLFRVVEEHFLSLEREVK